MNQHALQQNRRSAYRVTPTSDEDLSLTVLGKRQRLPRARITDVAIGGARVMVEKEDVADIDFSRRLDLNVISKKHAFEQEISAEVVYAKAEDSGLSLQLRFDQHLEGLDDHDEEVCELFNRRSFQRSARLQTNIDFKATLEAATAARPMGSEWFVKVYDISNVGVSLLVDESTHKSLIDVKEANLSLTLPEQSDRLSVACLIRHREKVEGGYRYGCEYDWDRTNDPLSTVEEIADYVMSCLESTM